MSRYQGNQRYQRYSLLWQRWLRCTINNSQYRQVFVFTRLFSLQGEYIANDIEINKWPESSSQISRTIQITKDSIQRRLPFPSNLFSSGPEIVQAQSE